MIWVWVGIVATVFVGAVCIYLNSQMNKVSDAQDQAAENISDATVEYYDFLTGKKG